MGFVCKSKFLFAARALFDVFEQHAFFWGGGIAGRLSLSLVPQKFERKEVSTEIVVYAERKIARVVWLFTGYLLVFLFYIT